MKATNGAGPLAALMCCLVAAVNSIDRTAMSVAILPMAQQYGWSARDKGSVASAFQWGHTFTNVAGGWAASTFQVVVWSAFTILTPAAAASGLPALLLVRGCMGLGEGVAFPCMQALIRAHVPVQHRGRALGIAYSGHQLGSMLSLLLSPAILATHGAHTLFYVYGALGFLWLAAWHPLVPANSTLSPMPVHETRSTRVGIYAAHMVISNVSGAAAAGGLLAPVKQLRDMPWRAFLRTPAVWAIAIAHSVFGLTYSICIAWLPTYFNDEYGLDVRQSAFMTLLPWLAMAAGTNVSGWLADTLISREVLSTLQTRRLLQAVGCAGPGLCLAHLALAGHSAASQAMILLTVALGALGMQSGGFASNHQDIAARWVPALFGLSNACGSLVASVGVGCVGWVLDATHSWAAVLLIIAACNGLSAAAFWLLASTDQLFD